MNQSKISVIIPVYGVEEYLAKCLESVIHQTFTNLEIILIDDGASEICKQICEKYEKQDKRIQVIHTPNQGLSEARNTGMKVATGEYISFIDSDDMIQKEMLEELYSIITQKQVDMASCQYQNFFEEKEIKPVKEEKTVEIFEKLEAIKELLKEQKITNHVWDKLYKKDVLQGIEFPKGKKLEDIAVMYQIIENCQKVGYIDKPYYYYRQRKSSILGNINEDLVLDFIEIAQKRYQALQGNYEELESKIAYSYMGQLLRIQLIAVRKPEIYQLPILKEKRDELRKMVEKYPSYDKEKNIPKKFRVFTKICCRHEKIFVAITQLFYKIKGRNL